MIFPTNQLSSSSEPNLSATKLQHIHKKLSRYTKPSRMKLKSGLHRGYMWNKIILK